LSACNGMSPLDNGPMSGDIASLPPYGGLLPEGNETLFAEKLRRRLPTIRRASAAVRFWRSAPCPHGPSRIGPDILRAMPDAMTLVQLLAELGGAELILRREESLLAVAVLVLKEGRQLLVIERTYREGIGVLLDPTPAEIEIARGGDLWKLWNSERTTLLYGAV
jgi:hypothetical protein